MRVALYILAVILSATSLHVPAMGADLLMSPFDGPLARERQGKPATPFACAKPPEPQRDLTMGGFYADRGAGSSVVDERAMATYRAATAAINKFEADLTTMADRYVASKPAEATLAACALDWLFAWSAADAMLGRASDQGGYVRKWGLAPISASYLKIREEPGLDAARKKSVEAWIGRWATVVRDDYNSTKNESRRNNHVYWAAWSVGLAAVVGDDRKLFAWSMDKARLGLKQVTPAGVLPLEMARKARAYHYHVFGAAPLVMVAELAARNGVDLYAEYDGALARLVGLTVAGYDDDGFFVKASGQGQDRSGSIKGNNFPWLEPYYARTADPAAGALIRRLRPMREVRVGGDLTMLFGVELN